MNAWSDSAHSRRKPSEQAVSIARKTWRRPTTGRAGLNGCAPRSTHGKPEPRFSGLRSSVFDANAPSRVGLYELSGLSLRRLSRERVGAAGRRREQARQLSRDDGDERLNAFRSFAARTNFST